MLCKNHDQSDQVNGNRFSQSVSKKNHDMTWHDTDSHVHIIGVLWAWSSNIWLSLSMGLLYGLQVLQDSRKCQQSTGHRSSSHISFKWSRLQAWISLKLSFLSQKVPDLGGTYWPEQQEHYCPVVIVDRTMKCNVGIIDRPSNTKPTLKYYIHDVHKEQEIRTANGLTWIMTIVLVSQNQNILISRFRITL